MTKQRTILSSLCGLLCFFLCDAKSQVQHKSNAADTLVLCNSDLQTALSPWVEYRKRQGHKIVVRFARKTAEKNKELIAEYAKGETLKNVLLVGDAGDRLLDPAKLVPTNFVPAKVNVLFGSEPKIATDNPYGDLDDDGIPEIAVGRLTADTPAELTSTCLLYTSPSPRDLSTSRMPSSA